MIIRNPVYIKEVRASNRSHRQISVFLIFNGLLAIAGLYVLGKIIRGMNQEDVVNYSMILQLYMILVTMECSMLFLVLPGLIAGIYFWWNSVCGYFDQHWRNVHLILLYCKCRDLFFCLGKSFPGIGDCFILIFIFCYRRNAVNQSAHANFGIGIRCCFGYGRTGHSMVSLFSSV